MVDLGDLRYNRTAPSFHRWWSEVKWKLGSVVVFGLARLTQLFRPRTWIGPTFTQRGFSQCRDQIRLCIASNSATIWLHLNPRILEWATIPSRGTSTQELNLGPPAYPGRLFTSWAIRDTLDDRCAPQVESPDLDSCRRVNRRHDSWSRYKTFRSHDCFSSIPPTLLICPS